MTIEQLLQRLEDLVNALERIAAVLEDVTADGRSTSRGARDD